jgi:hypothetical protein
MTIPVPAYDRSVLYFAADPVPYTVALPMSGKGFIFTPEGLGELDFNVTGIVPNPEHPLCTTPQAVGILDNYSGVVQVRTVEEMEVTYIRQGMRVTEHLEALTGIDPLRTLFISDAFGADIPGGLTIYGVDISTNLTEALYVGVASRMNFKDDFIFRKWTKVHYPGVLARPIVSGREFKLLLYTKGAGQFAIKKITVWAKLTDRRGFNTSPANAGNKKEVAE